MASVSFGHIHLIFFFFLLFTKFRGTNISLTSGSVNMTEITEFELRENKKK